ncbi:hypothetical protein [Mesotoga sp. HF07.pep.5.2.highcov]|uniref:hypothetical protein n=1 Tax=Mesotoga sp. HF07.pep.5.2.highcov TaxID=1462923 RepID=UPI0016022444|nr:hypothetical protein [Mesotoga sp. HF07.pep.5.2.highcov]
MRAEVGEFYDDAEVFLSTTDLNLSFGKYLSVFERVEQFFFEVIDDNPGGFCVIFVD